MAVVHQALTLRQLRQRNGLTQADVAAFLECTKHCVSQYETGRRRVSLVTALRLAALFQVPIETIAFPRIPTASNRD
ncbi:helix-turn-helix transcriptional regulator [Limnochorda pilosa]|uniref:helix-turn-helix transcriptional regulator n=1 Tax=Limnochorda pilosa TaxID=1555112 RepID=UPI0009E6A847